MDGQEIELKLAMAPEHMAALRLRPFLDGAEPKLKRLASIYFDTPDFALSAAGISLRVRRIDNGHIQTVKAPSTGAGGLFSRREWESPVIGAILNPDLLRATGLAIFDDELIAHLTPAFSTDIRRTVYHLTGTDGGLQGEWEVEAALDLGAVVAGDHSEPVCEVEFELVKGSSAHLFVLAGQVLESVPARPLVSSKAERGYRLASGHADEPTKAKAPPLTPTMTVADAFQTIARSCLDHLLTNERCLLATGNGEAVHQMRVALRRLRSALKVFRPVLDTPRLAEIKADLRWLLEHLGPARDADVFLAEIIDPVVARHPNDSALAALRGHWQADRDAKLRAACDAVASRRFAELVLGLGQWVEVGDWLGSPDHPRRRRLDAPIAPFALARLDKAVGKLIRVSGDNLGRLAPEELHAVRIQGKQVRYTGEFFATLVPRKTMKVFLAELSELQDFLGQINDISVAVPKLSGRHAEGGKSRAAGLVAGWHQSRRAQLLASAEKSWKRWRNSPLPWPQN